jgi:3-phosphoshikimate 1-carboxyvinyltransferase
VRKEKIGRPSECRASLLGGQRLESRDFTVPGDISSAAYWLVAAAAQPGSRLLIKNVGLNPARTAPLDVLLRMGARVREVVETPDHNEPCGVIDLKGAPLHGTVIEGAEIPHLIDELPLLAVAGALAQGETIIRDAGALRTKEIDRIAAVAGNLRALGVEVEEFDDGLRILGGAKLKGTKLSSHGDARIAKAFAIAGLFATGETVIENAACVRTAYSGFDITLKHIQKGNSLLQRRTPVISSLNGGRKRRKR